MRLHFAIIFSCVMPTPGSHKQKDNDFGLSKSIVKQLILDIESNRLALQQLRVTDFCCRKPDVYGDAATKRRRQVVNKLARWKGDPAQYLRARDKFFPRQGVKSSVVAQPTEQETTPSPPPSPIRPYATLPRTPQVSSPPFSLPVASPPPPKHTMTIEAPDDSCKWKYAGLFVLSACCCCDFHSLTILSNSLSKQITSTLTSNTSSVIVKLLSSHSKINSLRTTSCTMGLISRWRGTSVL